MGIRVSNLVPNNNTDANFRLWINEIHNSLLAFGWLQTADTGQINFASVTRPTVAGTYQGYATYQMNDALQSACACFIRLDFGTGANTDAPSIKFQVCIGGTNGSGTLTGNVAAQITLQCDTVNTTSFAARTSGSSSSFRMAMWPQSTATQRGWFFALERDLSVNGVEQSTGISFAIANHAGGTNASFWSQFLETAGGTGPQDTTRLYAFIHADSTQSGGGNVGVGPVRTRLGVFRNPMKGMILFARGDFGQDTTNPVSIYGSTHTYIMMRDVTSVQTYGTFNGDVGVALLWE